MADIDKALPNEVRKEFEVPGEEEIKELALEEVEQKKNLLNLLTFKKMKMDQLILI